MSRGNCRFSDCSAIKLSLHNFDTLPRPWNLTNIAMAMYEKVNWQSKKKTTVNWRSPWYRNVTYAATVQHRRTDLSNCLHSRLHLHNKNANLTFISILQTTPGLWCIIFITSVRWKTVFKKCKIKYYALTTWLLIYRCVTWWTGFQWFKFPPLIYMSFTKSRKA